MLSNNIQASEQLYRAVKRSKPSWLDAGKPTSAMFKDIGGVSVDRDGNRKEDEIIKFMQEISLPKRVKGIVRLSAEDCFKIEADIQAAPSENNPYHANILLDEADIHKWNLQARRLAISSQLIFFDENKEWTA